MMKLGIESEIIKKHKALSLALLGIGMVVIILLIPSFLNLIEFLGKRIPQENIKLDYIIGVFWAVFLGLTILVWPVRPQDKKALLWIWAVKCFVMLGLMLFYEYHYQIDSFNYFSSARVDINLWCNASRGSNFLLTFLIWLHQHCFLDSYHAVKVTFGMIGLAGVYIFYRSVVVFLHEEKLWLLYLFVFFPSILFWSSTLGKDPLVLFGITLYCYGAIKWFRQFSCLSAIILLLGIVITAAIRPWMGLILGLPVFFVTIFTLGRGKVSTRVAFMFVLISVVLVFTKNVFEDYGVKSRKDLTTVANEIINGFARGESIVNKEITPWVSKKNNTFSSIASMDTIRNIPRGIFTVLFRPLPGEVNNLFGFLAGIEGAFLLILFVLAIKRMRWRELIDPIIIWAILLILLWATLYGFIGLNLGTVCRYRLQILTVFLGLLMYLVRGKNKLIEHSSK